MVSRVKDLGLFSLIILFAFNISSKDENTKKHCDKYRPRALKDLSKSGREEALYYSIKCQLWSACMSGLDGKSYFEFVTTAENNRFQRHTEPFPTDQELEKAYVFGIKGRRSWFRNWFEKFIKNKQKKLAARN